MNMRIRTSGLFAGMLAATAICAQGQGSLHPPAGALSNGTPVAFMKTLDQVEPRRPIHGIPHLINEPGSYYLTTTVRGLEGLTITSDDVKVDLGGFAIESEGGDTSSGIDIQGTRHNIHIMNGVVKGWSQAGIEGFQAEESCYENVTAFQNEGDGLVIGGNSRIVKSGSFKNSGCGIYTGSGATVEDCKIRDNGSTGVVVKVESKIIGCIAGGNSRAGIAVPTGCVIKDCIANANMTDGIVIGHKNRVCGNNAHDNDAGAGIRIMGSGNTLSGNSMMGNKIGMLANGTTATNNIVYKNSAGGNSSGNFVNLNGESNVFGQLVQGAQVLGSSVGSWANFDLDN